MTKPISVFARVAPWAICVAVLAAGCGIPREAYDRDLGELSRQLVTVEEREGQLHQEKKELQARLEALYTEKGRATEAMIEAMRRADELAARAARYQRVVDQITNALRGMVSAGKLEVVQKQGLLVVQMAEAILFDTARSELKPEGRAAIIELTQALVGVGDRRFQVAGHTDARGSESFNWRLSCDRALSVVATMREAGMPGDRISAAGHAWFMPDASNLTDEGRARNRRIEIVLIPNLEELLQVPE